MFFRWLKEFAARIFIVAFDDAFGWWINNRVTNWPMRKVRKGVIQKKVFTIERIVQSEFLDDPILGILLDYLFHFLNGGFDILGCERFVRHPKVGVNVREAHVSFGRDDHVVKYLVYLVLIHQVDQLTNKPDWVTNEEVDTVYEKLEVRNHGPVSTSSISR
jgi:hypothetical protein